MSLGENEDRVVDLLRRANTAPAACQVCTRTFKAGYYVSYGTGHGQPVGWTVTFSHARVRQIESNGELTVDGAIA